MKKLFIIFLMILVIAVVGFYAYNEFHVREISYVNDYQTEEGRNRSAVRRLYSSDVDFEKYNETLERLISLEFTEDEIMKAALESGEPEFYPTFHTSVFRESSTDETFTLRTRVLQELAEGQVRTNFRLSNLRLEVISNGVTIDEVTAESLDTLNNTKKETPLINEQGTGMTVSLANYGDTEIVFNGSTGTVVLQYVYDIESVSLLPQVVMTDCFLRINVQTQVDEDGRLTAEYSIDKAATVEDYVNPYEEGEEAAGSEESAQTEQTAQ